MRKSVEEVIGNCDTCIRNKLNRHAPYELMKLPDTPARAWKLITLDFITKLLFSIDPTISIKYNAILIITNRLTKYVYFLSWRTTATAENVAYELIRTIIANHGVPNEIILDKNKLFISKVWTILLALFNVIRKLSISFHPQTDEQTKRINQIVKQYLKYHINYRQND